MCDPTEFAARYVGVLGERLGLSASVSKHDIVVEFDDLTLHIINTAPSDPESCGSTPFTRPISPGPALSSRSRP